MSKLKIWHISDTHSYHYLLEQPENIDIVIHSGDFSNYHDFYRNEPEARDFINWYGGLDVKYKILIAGNHDAFPAISPKEFRDLCEAKNIIYLENESIEIEGIKIFGTPVQPNFGNWYFQKPRHKLDEFWKHIPEDTDILIVHGPPRNKLDLSYNRNGELEFCGCRALDRHITTRIKPKLVCFGHIHSMEGVKNAGILYENNIYYSNGSVVMDNKFGKIYSNGNIFNYENKNINIG